MPELNPLVSAKLFDSIRDEAAVLDIPHDPFMLMSVNQMADNSTQSVAENSAAASDLDYHAYATNQYDVIAERNVVLYKTQSERKVHATSCDWSCCSGGGTRIATLKANCLVPVYAEKEIQVAEIIYEEPVPVEYEIKTYPNPFNIQATLDIENYDGEPYTFAMFDLSGKLIDLRESVTDNRLTIDRGDLASGIYIWKLITISESQVKSGKVVVQ